MPHRVEEEVYDPNMPNTPTQVVLFLSSYVPFLLLAQLLETFGRGWPSVASGLLAILSTAGLFAFVQTARRLSPTPLRAASVRPRDSDAVTYLLTYILPFIAFTNSDGRLRLAMLSLLVMVAFLYVRAHIFYLNPLLAIAGYRLYDVELSDPQTGVVISSIILLSKKSHLDKDEVSAARSLTSYIFLEAGS